MEPMSQGEYAKHIDRSQQYVSKLVAKGKIPTLPDGKIDPDAADLARRRNTRVHLGETRKRRREARKQVSQIPATPTVVAMGANVCSGCGDRYLTKDSQRDATPNPQHYCSPDCEQDAADGFTPKQIARRRESGILNKRAARPVPPPYVAPPPAPFRLATCMGCGGLYNVLDDDFFPAKNPKLFCGDQCEGWVSAGISTAEIRRHLKRDGVLSGDPKKQLASPTYFDRCNADGSTHYEGE